MKQLTDWPSEKRDNSGLPGNRYVLDIPPSALRLRSVNFLLIAVCEPYPVGLGSPCGFVAARHSPLLHGLFERAYDPLLFAAAVRGETQKRQADLDENTVLRRSRATCTSSKRWWSTPSTSIPRIGVLSIRL